MNKVNRGDDAADHAPRPVEPKVEERPESRDQEAPNYDVTDKGGSSIKVEDVNSANDE